MQIIASLMALTLEEMAEQVKVHFFGDSTLNIALEKNTIGFPENSVIVFPSKSRSCKAFQ